MRRSARRRSARSSIAQPKQSMPREKRGASRAIVIKAGSPAISTCYPRRMSCSRTCALRATCSPARLPSTSRWYARSAAVTRSNLCKPGGFMTKLESQTLDAAAEAAEDARNRAKRKKMLLILGSIVLKGAIGYALYSHYYGSKFISTENAYTAAENAQVTPAISGIVREVRVSDTQQVRSGDVIVVLDDTDARLALTQAEAELGRALRRVRGYLATVMSLAAQLVAANADLERAKVDLDRREALAATGSVSGDELTKARN